MKKNFEISGLVILQTVRHKLDLHNDFELREIATDLDRRRVTMKWKSISGLSSANSLTISFYDVLRIISNVHVSVESRVLNIGGYLRSNEESPNEGIIEEEDRNDGDNSVFLFEDNSYVIVSAARARAFVSGPTG